VSKIIGQVQVFQNCITSLVIIPCPCYLIQIRMPIPIHWRIMCAQNQFFYLQKQTFNDPSDSTPTNNRKKLTFEIWKPEQTTTSCISKYLHCMSTVKDVKLKIHCFPVIPWILKSFGSSGLGCLQECGIVLTAKVNASKLINVPNSQNSESFLFGPGFKGIMYIMYFIVPFVYNWVEGQGY